MLANGHLQLGLALFVGGAAAASTNAASGRIAVGWFPPRRRGLAMGIRQMAQPTGLGLAAVTIPVVADRHGIAAALWVLTAACVVAAVIVSILVIDPPRVAGELGTSQNPYLADSSSRGCTASLCS